MQNCENLTARIETDQFVLEGIFLSLETFFTGNKSYFAPKGQHYQLPTPLQALTIHVSRNGYELLV